MYASVHTIADVIARSKGGRSLKADKHNSSFLLPRVSQILTKAQLSILSIHPDFFVLYWRSECRTSSSKQQVFGHRLFQRNWLKQEASFRLEACIIVSG